MNGRVPLKASRALEVAAGILLVVAIIWQRNTINQLKAEIERVTASVPSPESQQTTQAQHQPNTAATIETWIPSNNFFQPAALSLAPTNAPSNSAVELRDLQQQNQTLAVQIGEVRAALAKAKSLTPEPEDRLAAYCCEGTWVNIDPATRGVTRIMISPGGGELVIKAWGACSPRDCEWDEIPFILLQPGASKDYMRGFATWELPETQETLLVTFEKSGLKVEQILVRKTNGGIGQAHQRTVEQMRRVN